MKKSEPDFPNTIEEAIQLVLSRLTDEGKEYLRNFPGTESDLELELIIKGAGSLMDVRAILGLWGKNPRLLAQLPIRWRHPDSASTFFLLECWRRLINNVLKSTKNDVPNR